MSYKLNLKNPERAEEMRERRIRQRLATVTRLHPKAFRVKREGVGFILVPYNKYILSGPNTNVASPANIIWE